MTELSAPVCGDSGDPDLNRTTTSWQFVKGKRPLGKLLSVCVLQIHGEVHSSDYGDRGSQLWEHRLRQSHAAGRESLFITFHRRLQADSDMRTPASLPQHHSPNYYTEV